MKNKEQNITLKANHIENNIIVNDPNTSIKKQRW